MRKHCNPNGLNLLGELFWEAFLNFCFLKKNQLNIFVFWSVQHPTTYMVCCGVHNIAFEQKLKNVFFEFCLLPPPPPSNLTHIMIIPKLNEFEIKIVHCTEGALVAVTGENKILTFGLESYGGKAPELEMEQVPHFICLKV